MLDWAWEITVLIAVSGLALWLWYYLRIPVVQPLWDLELLSVNLPEGSVTYVDIGTGPTVIMLHGIGANLFCWRRLWPLLSPNFRVIALDLPGFGRSHKNGEDFGLDKQTQNIADFMNALNIKEAHLIGNSMGANIALWFAASYPNRVKSVTAIAPATESRLVPFPIAHMGWASGMISVFAAKFLMGWAHRRTVSKHELVDILRVDETWSIYAKNRKAVRSFILATRAITDRRLKTTLTKIVDPVLILWGTKDRLVPEWVIKSLEATLKKSYVKIHSGAGHHLQEDEPEWVAQQFNSFVSLEK